MRYTTKNRIFAVVTVVSLFLSQIVFATGAEVDTQQDIQTMSTDPTKPTIYVDYLGTSTDSSGPGSKQNVPVFTTDNIDTVFWVGVGLSNLDQVNFIKTYGIYGMELGFDYDPNFVEPCSVLTADELTGAGLTADTDDAWKKTLEKFNFSAGIGTEADGWDSSSYELLADSGMSVVPDSDSNREEIVPSTWKMSFVSLKKKTGLDSTTNKFINTTSTETQYILKIPFRLKNVPADDSKPLVFKVSRGPSTFVLSAGDGIAQFAAWEKTSLNPANNLKTIFTFDKDLNIFGGEETTAIEDMSVTKVGGTGDGQAGDLFEDNTLGTAITYDPTIKEYFMRVPADTTDVAITMKGDVSTATAKHSDNKETPTETVVGITQQPDSTWKTDNVALLDVDTTLNSGFNNTVIITLGTEEYKVHIQKLVEAKIVLNPGNSPYGMIMNEAGWDDAKKEAARKEFDKKNQFVTGYVPTGMDNSIVYTANAWGDSRTMTELPAGSEITDITKQYINYDKDETAIFVQMRAAFEDPGFTLTDSLGNAIQLTDAGVSVSRQLTMQTMNNLGTAGFETNVSPKTSADDFDGTVGEDVKKIDDFATVRVRPGVYKMTYTLTDSYGETATIERAVICYVSRGDYNLDTLVNATDSPILIMREVNKLPTSQNVKTENITSGRVYEFRTADLNSDKLINAVDVPIFTLRETKPIKVFYKNATFK